MTRPLARFAVAAAVAALAVAPMAAHAAEPPVQAPALAPADVRAAIQARYAALKAALESGNAAMIPLLLAPDFTVTPRGGPPLPASVLLAGMARLSAVPVLHVTLNPESISAADDSVVVHQNYDFEIPEVDGQGGRHQANVDMVSTDVWVDLSGRWVLQSMVFTHWSARYDGRAVETPCFGCYPSAG